MRPAGKGLWKLPPLFPFIFFGPQTKRFLLELELAFLSKHLVVYAEDLFVGGVKLLQRTFRAATFRLTETNLERRLIYVAYPFRSYRMERG